MAKTISIRIDEPLLHKLKRMAAKRHLPYQTLIHTILAEKIRSEFKAA